MALHFPALSAAIATMSLSRPDAGLYDRTAAGEGRSSAPPSENLVALAKSLAALTTGDQWKPNVHAKWTFQLGRILFAGRSFRKDADPMCLAMDASRVSGHLRASCSLWSWSTPSKFSVKGKVRCSTLMW